jgi:hypothetical protein
MQHRLPHLSPLGGWCVPPRLAVGAVGAVVFALVAVAALVAVFAMKLAAPSQS